jgi:TQXA domain-containing protein
MRTNITSRVGVRPISAVIATVLALATLAIFTPGASAAEPSNGDSVYVAGELQGYGGTGLHGIFVSTPSDPGNPGTPDYWAYCVEHDVSAKSGVAATVQDASSYFGANYFTNPTIQSKVRWVLAHSYPHLSLAAFGTAAGTPGISVNDAIEATQYAIWRYTDLTWDAPWSWSSTNSEIAYWYLVNGANASSGLTASDVQATVTLSGPVTPAAPNSLVGPFTVHTNQPSASVTVSPSHTITDALGNTVSPSALTDGQQFYVDLRGVQTAGSASVTATVTGSGLTGQILFVPTTVGGTATAGNHAQTLALVAPSTATTTATAAIAWAAVPVPTIGTTLVDHADNDHTLAHTGGTLTDTIAYQNLVPGTEYKVTGVLMKKSDGTSTGITGSTTFTPTTANGTIDVTFTVPNGYAGQSLVAYETLTTSADTTTVVAEHKDINDTNQTVAVATVPATPTIGTTLVDHADNDHTLAHTGGTLTDTIAYQNLVPGTEYKVTGVLMKKSDGTSTGITGSTTFTPTTANGTIDVTFTVPNGYAGQSLVAYETLTTSADTTTVVAEHKDINDTNQTVTVETSSPGTGTVTKTRPTITTQTSATRLIVGRPLHDRVKITGFTAGGTATGVARLYGPYTSRTAATCAKAHLVGSVTFTPRNDTFDTPSITVRKPGYYTWVASTTADTHNVAASHGCGLVSETTLVHKPAYGSPIVATGFTGFEGLATAQRTGLTEAKLRYAGIGASASSGNVGISNGAVNVPGNVNRLGTVTPSAGLGDAVGTTVIVGHVSDDSDSPGAFYRLSKAKKGQVITVKQAGKTYRFRVTSIKKYSRANGGHPPASVFSTTGAHKLALISCTDKVVSAGGRFHYTRNVVVTATPIK